jgi:hypothetical protein
MELRSIDGDEVESLYRNNNNLRTPTPSPGADSGQHLTLGGGNFSPAAENRRNIIVPEIQPWPPSPYEKASCRE